MRMWLFDCALCASVLSFVGCGVIGRPSVKPPEVSPSQAASAAIDLCDKDSNGLLAASELSTSPALLAALENYDTSGDEQLDHAEISARLSDMYSRGSAFTSLICQVTLDGRPLRRAQVRFVPEPFLGDEVELAEGITDGSGSAAIGIADDQLPEKVRGLKVMQLGLYRVEITHATAKIPAKYNTQTTLGHELHGSSPDEPVVFRLSSK